MEEAAAEQQQQDRWAGKGWESAGLGEDTPMGGMSSEEDVRAEQWRAFDERLEGQQGLAERCRAAVQHEMRRAYGAGVAMGTREFVRHRLGRMDYGGRG